MRRCVGFSPRQAKFGVSVRHLGFCRGCLGGQFGNEYAKKWTPGKSAKKQTRANKAWPLEKAPLRMHRGATGSGFGSPRLSLVMALNFLHLFVVLAVGGGRKYRLNIPVAQDLQGTATRLYLARAPHSPPPPQLGQPDWIDAATWVVRITRTSEPPTPPSPLPSL